MNTISLVKRVHGTAAALIILTGAVAPAPREALAQASAEVQVLERIRVEHGAARLVLLDMRLRSISRTSVDGGAAFSTQYSGAHSDAWVAQLLAEGLIDEFCSPSDTNDCASAGTLTVRMSRLVVQGPEATVYAIIAGQDALGDTWHVLTSFKFERADDSWVLSREERFVEVS